ncbi:MAG: ArdC-like ssDNA-binding domain-containing protein, partial [Lysobacter sp.]
MGLLHSLRASQALTPSADSGVAAGLVPSSAPRKKFDRLQDATDSFLRHVDNGECHWQQPDPAQAFAPINGISGRPFYAFNALRLSMRGCNDDPRWCTAKQAKAQGWWIRKGESGTHLLAWEQSKEDTGRLDADGHPEYRTHPMLYAFKVFNFSQLDGPAPFVGTHPTLAEVHDQVMPIAEGMGVTIKESVDRAPGYCSAQDVVHVR